MLGDAPNTPVSYTHLDVYKRQEAGFPINRVEKLPRVREWLKAQEQASPLPEKEKAPAVTADRNNYRITEDTLGVGGAKEKFKANMAAVNLLHDLEIENRLATPEEQKILAGYVGCLLYTSYEIFEDKEKEYLEQLLDLNDGKLPSLQPKHKDYER